jgi:hypothetical protein
MPTDSSTILRLKYLADVGNALMESSNETSLQTNYFAAKEALNKFQAELTKVEMPLEISSGMQKLITYLQLKIDRRLQNSTKDE